MAFWEETFGEKKLLIGDEPVDLLMQTFQEISKVYVDDVGRNPTLAELETLIQKSLEYQEELVFSDMQGHKIAGCKLKVKKTGKISFKSGDVFGIPLNNSEIYGYGMIVKGTQKPLDEVYIEYYDIFTERLIRINEFKNIKKEKLFTANSGIYGILEGEWSKIGSLPFDGNKYEVPDFYGEINGSYYISKGIANEPDARVWVSKEEAELVKNPDGLIGSGIIAKWLYREYLNSTQN